MNEDKATCYHRLRRRAVLLSAAWRVFLLAFLIVSGLAQALRETFASAFGALPLFLQFPLTVLALVTVVAVMLELGALPMTVFAGLTLERRYGLSHQRTASWCRDHGKAAAVNLAFVGASAVWMYAWLAAAPDGWWIPAWAGLVAAGIVTAWAAPVVLLPLFFRFVPLPDGALRERLLALAAKAGVPALGVFEWRTSDRTSRANAAFTGIGRTRRIILSDTLLGDYKLEEIEAVLAHEVAHHMNHDIWKGLAVDAAAVLGALLAADAALRAAAGPAGLQGLADPAGLPVAGLALTAVGWLALPLQNAVSRAHERAADRAALELTGNPHAFVSAMRRLGARNLAEESPALLTRLLFHTHPPIDERIAFAAAWEAERNGRTAAESPAAGRVKGGGA
ncbi:MAG: M48 family metalloprotease [Vicinamibacterales bacterium]|jgi:STE24 endopeptidase|nr:M48 family metalloprotease [Vicinamibacterales bacterium]